ncbi:MAG: chemotaxis protein, partial [Chitinophagaceae bacterium]
MRNLKLRLSCSLLSRIISDLTPTINNLPTEHQMNLTSEHCIVAIGASAGGLEAIHDFFDHMPGKPDVSFVIIQHLSPDHKSLLVELVSRHTQMSVAEAGENMQLLRNCIYVIPNNKLMTVENNRLVLEAKKTNYSPNNAIDFFLLSLAAEKKHRGIAVILSGTGSDGTRGIEAVKKAGGLVIVQDPETAKFNGMPNSAIQSGVVDHIIAPKQMPEEILRYLAEPVLQETQPVGEQQLDEIFTLIHKEAGNDFHFYKLPTINRRIFRRMSMIECNNIDDYLEKLRIDAGERLQLGKDFLIGVTKFFRDSEAFELLKEQVLIPLIRSKRDGDTLKIWVCACSTGEEVYSIAIALDHLLTEANKVLEVKIFATDIDEAAIDIAARGCYPRLVERDIPAPLLRKYFLPKENQYQIIPMIRKQIVFAKHNVAKDPPFINNDLVTCRNMLIYLNPMLQQKVLAVLLYGVMVNKYLLLGPSESIGALKDDVTELSSKWKLYRKLRETRIAGQFAPERTESRINKTDRSFLVKTPDRPKTFWDDLKEALNEDLSFAAFYIDAGFNILEAAGNYSKFLSMPRKVLQLNLLSMIPQELYLMLGAELR